jgi:hypothetical protein
MFDYNLYGMSTSTGILLVIVTIWTLFWKGCALWIAGKKDQKWWFLVLLVVNTVGILEIVYIFYVAKKKWVDVKEILTVNKTAN